jgi:DNA-binding winged helix-turn-helix (wHTH) protein
MPTRLEHVARWRAALTTGDGGEARRLMEGAIEGSDATENAFLQIMMRVSAALLFPEQRRRLLEARTIAQPIESPPLLASLELLIDAPSPANYGIFTHLAARVARSPLKASKNLLHIEVLRGHVLRGSEVVHVADRGFELLVALAMLPAGIAKEELAATIWPSLDSEAALNTLKMCVSRTRSQLGDRGAIESTKRGYALGERIIVDVREIERLAYRSASASIAGEDPDRELNAAVAATYDLTYAAGWSWFAPYAAHLDELHWRLREQREVAVPVSP